MQRDMHKRSSRGFSFVELAISLVVIGLIVGAVLAGQTMLRNQRIQSMMSELDANISAVKLFQEKYTALPGDMPTANTIWSSATSGDGNGLIVSDYTANPDEMYQAWYHLSLAELVSGQYSGSGASWAITPGANVPESRLQQNAGWLLFYVGTRASDAEFFDGVYGHVMMVASKGRSAATNAGVLSPNEQYEIDFKYDDGAISTGSIRGLKSVAGGFTSLCASGTAYNTATKNHECAPVFITGF